jgi:hypothetical protein
MNAPTTTANRRKLEFDKKLKQIESDELKLKALEQELIRLQIRMATETAPIVEEYCELRVENLTKLKSFLSDAFFKKKEKRQIIHLMVELAVGLQNIGDARAQGFLDELIPQEEAEVEEEREEFHTHQFTPNPPSEKHAEGKLEIKSLFRSLAKAFHPDKEPLEHLKEEKTDIMKKITAAYENQDLYGLLKLEKEHLGPREFTEDKIELYIKHINDRLKGLKTFEASLKKHGPLSTIYRFIYSRKTTILEYNIRNELSKIEDEVQKEKELQPIIWDRSSLRHFLKQ